MTFLMLFASVVLYKLISNFVALMRTKKLRKGYVAWLNGSNPDYVTYKFEILHLFKKAAIEDMKFVTTENIGEGLINTGSRSVFTNFFSLHPTVRIGVTLMFNDAYGVYRKRMIDAINPLYWIDFIVFLPKNIFGYLNIDLEKNFNKIINLLLTAIWWILSIFFIWNKNDILLFMNQLINKLG